MNENKKQKLDCGCEVFEQEQLCKCVKRKMRAEEENKKRGV